MKNRLTDRQQIAFSFIERYLETRRRPPTLQEITDAVGARSVNTAQKLVHALEQKGYVTREKGKARSLAIPGDVESEKLLADQTFEVLIRKAGTVLDSPLARLLAERLRVDKSFMRGISSPGACFAIRAGDHGMQPDGIFKGDLVLVVPIPSERLAPGEIVVCSRRGEFLVRQLDELGGLLSLVASDLSFATIHPEPPQTQIEGRVVAIMRRL